MHIVQEINREKKIKGNIVSYWLYILIDNHKAVMRIDSLLSEERYIEILIKRYIATLFGGNVVILD